MARVLSLGVLGLLYAAGAGTSFGSPLETPVALPVVPPPHVRLPGAFDESGCALISIRSSGPRRLCPARGATPSTAAGWSRHLGYVGPRAVSHVAGTGVVLLADTLNVASSGSWRATGLVRNQTTERAHEVRVTVILATADDWILGTATAVIPVLDVRPGEPAPFELRTLLPAEAVRRIEWSVTAGPGAGPGSSRSAEIEIGRVGPAPVRRMPPLRSILEPPAASAAAEEGTWIGWGILRNWGPEPLEDPVVVGAWIDERGRAVRMVDGRMLHDDGASIAMSPRATRTFELFEREPGEPHGVGWRLALWQTSL
ncbi:MAG: hypothetical protein FJ148_03435 [Deltaproteobacteria bacterium]|nr:hypothetical protein [Deltaproteobacteria bacterium]